MSNRTISLILGLAAFAAYSAPVDAADGSRVVAAIGKADASALPFSGAGAGQGDVAADHVSTLPQLMQAASDAAQDVSSQSQFRAFSLYQRIVAESKHIEPGHADAGDVASAFVALGAYYRTGIKGALGANKARAVSLLHYAASFYGDADAQCDLARMYLNGDGVPQNARLAANWLANAAKKRHGRSQALLGDLLMRGADVLPQQPEKGLALLSLARQNAADEAEGRWIEGLYRGALVSVGDLVRDRAGELAHAWQSRFGQVGPIQTVQSDVAAESAVEAVAPDAISDGVIPVRLEEAAAAR